MCKENGETVDHLLLYCSYAREIWSMILNLFGISWVMLRGVLALLECWQGKFGRHRNFSVWWIVPHCVMRCLWREQNDRNFEDCKQSFIEIKHLVLCTIFDWVAAQGLFHCDSFFTFLDACSCRPNFLYFLVYVQYTGFAF
jgi:hypothetical protein